MIKNQNNQCPKVGMRRGTAKCEMKVTSGGLCLTRQSVGRVTRRERERESCLCYLRGGQATLEVLELPGYGYIIVWSETGV